MFMSAKRDERADVTEGKVYREFLAERDEILRHKWLASERAGYDIGFDQALTEWILKYRSGWREARRSGQS